MVTLSPTFTYSICWGVPALFQDPSGLANYVALPLYSLGKRMVESFSTCSRINPPMLGLLFPVALALSEIALSMTL